MWEEDIDCALRRMGIRSRGLSRGVSPPTIGGIKDSRPCYFGDSVSVSNELLHLVSEMLTWRVGSNKECHCCQKSLTRLTESRVTSTETGPPERQTNKSSRIHSRMTRSLANLCSQIEVKWRYKMKKADCTQREPKGIEYKEKGEEIEATDRKITYTNSCVVVLRSETNK